MRISVIIWVLANLWALGWHLHPKIKVHLVHHQSTLPIRVCLWGWARSCKHLYLVQVNSCGMHSWWSVLVGCLWGSPLAFRGDYPRVLEVPFSSFSQDDVACLVQFSSVWLPQSNRQAAHLCIAPCEAYRVKGWWNTPLWWWHAFACRLDKSASCPELTKTGASQVL